MMLQTDQPRYSPPVVTALTAGKWGPLSVTKTTEDIRHHTGWDIHGDDHTIIIHLQGEMRGLETEIEGKGVYRGPANPGGLWLIPAGCRYSSHACGRTIDYVRLEISPQALAQFSGRAGMPIGELNWTLGNHDPFLFRAATRLIELSECTDDISSMTAASIAQAVCWHLIARYGQGRSPPKSKTDTLSMKIQERLVNFIYDNVDKRIRVKDLAQIAGVAESEFFSRFDQAFGMTPAHYIVRQRLNRARWLLGNTPGEITRIALETGFSSHSHLTTAFKREFGTTPSQFRRRQRD